MTTTMTPPAPIAMITPDPAADARRRRGLRQMRTLAVCLLLLAAVVYLVTLGEDGVLGFVNAGAEASMVGAIADWFAVTAIFKHPLGLPIPHTALIPKRKDDLGRSLEEFVGENFLQEGVIRERVASAAISERVGAWLADPEHVRRVVDEVSEVASIGLGKVRDEHVSDLVTEALIPRFREEPLAPLAGGLLAEVVRDGVHEGVVDLALDELHGWLLEHPDTVAEVLEQRAPWWAPPRLNDAVTRRVTAELVTWLAEIRADPAHRARLAFDSMLTRLAEDLQHDPETRERTERLKDRVLDHPQVVQSSIALWNALRRALQASLLDPDGAVRDRLARELTAFGVRLREDAELRGRLDGAAADLSVFAVERYGAELTAVITHTVERWDGREAARRIELHVGRDLQFIRINGTIVGGLVGLVIHAVTVVVR
ncbi:DUF445 domain-containing protein [Nocardioides sp.]|jgi:uncharacterized membrane-anchored protein YjiN (DUF445 family)|uniref:DUF445 domain-containing protein n=1 Tax=Nocardioides sp. TaxID=35761 RepID=UPI002F42D960